MRSPWTAEPGPVLITAAFATAGSAACRAVVVLTRQAVTGLATAANALVDLAALRFGKKLPEPHVVLAAGTLGLLLHWPSLSLTLWS